MLTRDLKKSNANEVVHGKLIINLTTNVSTPASHPGVQGNMLPPTTNHNRNPSSSSTSRGEEGTSLPVNNGQSGAGTSSSASTTSPVNGRPFSSFEDQHGPLPPG
jgi:E3 ubiquitin-protein ligase NEDD4